MISLFKRLVRFILGSDWEIINHDCSAVYVDDKTLGFEHFITKRHKITGEIRRQWIPAA